MRHMAIRMHSTETFGRASARRDWCTVASVIPQASKQGTNYHPGALDN